MKKRIILELPFLLLLLAACKQPLPKTEWTMTPDKATWSDTDYVHPPQSPFDTSDYVIELQNMKSFYNKPGEFGYLLDGKDYGFESLSFILTNTQPHGGPPLHVHETEEAHILIEGEVLYYVGGKEFSAKGPYVARVPAGVPHTFINNSNKPFHLVCAFPGKYNTYKKLGPNPLLKDSAGQHNH
ncbi:MAG: cupin domain-containing protein [Cyclobacteriaceae bacterium]